MSFQKRELRWGEFLKKVKPLIGKWIFRGQSFDEPLKSSFERALDSYRIPYSDAPGIEDRMIRDFKRKYEGMDFEIVSKDTFYCLSLMQHCGCPTRLLDWTYSPYVAAFFAVESMFLGKKGRGRNAFIFCLNHEWLNRCARSQIKDDNLFKMRFDDKTLTDESFIPLYMKERKKFILADNPY